MLKTRSWRPAWCTLFVVALTALGIALPAFEEKAAADPINGSFEVAGLAVSDVAADDIGVHSAVISWTTSSGATSQVFYDTHSHDDIVDYAYHTSEDSDLDIGHSISLTGLSSSTTYHYRVRSRIPADSSVAISDDGTFRTSSRSAPTPDYDHGSLGTDLFGSSEDFHISDSGEILETIEATSDDGSLHLTIEQGTIALDSNGRPLGYLEVLVDESPPPPPPGGHIIALPYVFRPSGAVFDPPITLEFTYDPSDLPAGVDEDDLVIAYYNEELGVWVECPGNYDRETHRLTVSIYHFTCFALVAYAVSAEPAPGEPAPPPAPVPELQPTPAPEAPQPAPMPTQPQSAPSPPGFFWGILAAVLGVTLFLAILLTGGRHPGGTKKGTIT